MSGTSTDRAPKAEYINCFYNPSHGHDPAVYGTEAKPAEYRGYLIYNRIKSTSYSGCWDVVKDGMCVGQYAGRSGAERFVDMLHGEGDAEMVAFHRERNARILESCAYLTSQRAA